MLIYVWKKKNNVEWVEINEENYKSFEEKLNKLVETLKIIDKKDLALIPVSEWVVKVKIWNKSAVFINLYIKDEQ